MKAIYLDNAATTPITTEVLETMLEVQKNVFGNPSSTHSFGRKAKSIIVQARKNVAKHIGAQESEVFFTSGGTEADNMALYCAVRDLNVNVIITSKVEHHAVLHTAEKLQEEKGVRILFVNLDIKGNVDLEHLELLLKEEGNKLVSLMHANNEIGNILPLKKVSELCKLSGAYLHSDTVQAIGHLPISVKELGVDFLSSAAHKFHGPKGVGFIYIRKKMGIQPFVYGGAQERGMRGGTENVHGIAGLSKALSLAIENQEVHMQYVLGLKEHMKKRILNEISCSSVNGEEHVDNSLYTVLSIHFDTKQDAGMILMRLDLDGIAASGGSACASGTLEGSHVMSSLGKDFGATIRFSFSHLNTMQEIEYSIDKLKEIIE